MSNRRDAQQLIQEAGELVAAAQQALDASDEFYRSQGLDPEKVRAVLAENLDEKGAAQARAQFEQDMEAMEREVAEEAARASFAAPLRTGGAKKPRFMV